MEQELRTGMGCSRDPLGEAARRGAQLILQRMIEEELDEFLGRKRYERKTESQPGYRNGYESKKVHLAEGSIELAVPQLRETVAPFESVWLKAIGRRSKRLMELIPLLYVKGMSQRDIEEALSTALGVEQSGRNVVTDVCRNLRSAFEAWQNRDLSSEEIVYLFLDGLYLDLRPEDKGKIAALCAYGIRWDGKKALLHLAVGDKESAVCWEAFLEDMKQRGLKDPLLAVIDGASGLRKAVGRKLPNTWVQRGQAHKMRNILNKLPQTARHAIKKRLQAAFTALTYEQGVVKVKALLADFTEAFPSAMKCLEQDMAECLTVLKFPYAHRINIRTTNLLERLFGEGRRRTKIIPRFTSEQSGLSLVYAVLVDASEGWRGVRMRPDITERLQQLSMDPNSSWIDPEVAKLTAA
jgi:transposase-like protein